MHQYGPREQRAGRRGHRALRVAALTLLAVAGLAAAAACGDGGEDDAEPAGSSTATAAATEVTTSVKPADLMPDLSGSGYQKVDAFAGPVAQAGQQNYRTVWAKTANTNLIALVDATVFAKPEDARTNYTTVSAAWKNPPPGLVGGVTGFVDTPSPAVGDERKSYTPSGADSKGNKIWTDVYRIGNVVVVVQVIDAAQGEQMALREQLAKDVAAKVR
ncbi:MAG: hypothetical protein IT303_18545 [Dehalococcoidia bacterium]|nr:hypothetical protein [Dehalococcoidia bacterium]